MYILELLVIEYIICSTITSSVLKPFKKEPR